MFKKTVMKLYFKIFIFLLFGNSTFGQDVKPKPIREVGININSILNAFLFETTREGQFPSIQDRDRWASIIYRSYNGPKTAFRLGLGMMKRSKTEDFTSPGFSTSEFKSSVKYFAAQIGFHRQYYLHEKIGAYSGFDFFYKNEKNTSENDGTFVFIEPSNFGDKTVIQNHIFGLGIPLGIQFFITERISISTEMMIEGSTTFRKEIFENTNGGNSFSNDEDSEFIDFDFRAPMALWISYRF